MDVRRKLEVISDLVDKKIEELNMEITILKECTFDSGDIYNGSMYNHLYEQTNIYNLALLNNLNEEKKEYEYYSKLLKNYRRVFNKDEVEYAEKHLYLDLIQNLRIIELINKKTYNVDKKRSESQYKDLSLIDDDYRACTQINFDINKSKTKGKIR